MRFRGRKCEFGHFTGHVSGAALQAVPRSSGTAAKAARHAQMRESLSITDEPETLPAPAIAPGNVAECVFAKNCDTVRGAVETALARMPLAAMATM